MGFANLLLLSSLLIFSGCSYKRVFAPITRDKKIPEYAHVGYVTPSSEQVLINNDINPGALTGMGYGVIFCLEMGEGGSDVGAIVAILCLPFGIVGGIMSGAGESSSLDKLKKEKGSIQGRLNAHATYKKLQDISIAYALKNQINISSIKNMDKLYNEDNTTNYSFLASKGIDTIIKLKVDKISLDETAILDVPVFITLQVNGKLIKTANGAILGTRTIEVKSLIHDYRDWIANNFKLLESEFNTLLKIAATNIIDELLLLYYPALSKELVESSYPPDALDLLRDDVMQNKNKVVHQKTERYAPYYVLSANYPEPTKSIKEQQPLLQWESFPWRHDEISQDHFRDIVYDLEIYKYRGPLIYERRGLKENKHKIEDALDRDTKYIWTVRARFKLDGKPRVTEWSGLYPDSIFKENGIHRVNVPDKKSFYYLFIIE